MPPKNAPNNPQNPFPEDSFEPRPRNRRRPYPAALKAVSFALYGLMAVIGALLAIQLYGMATRNAQLRRAEALNSAAREVVRQAKPAAAIAIATAPPIAAEAPAAATPAATAPEPTAAPTPTPVRPEILALRDSLGNPEIVGYLSITDTNMNYPIAQGADNEYYLTHDARGEHSVSGAIFLDYASAADFSGKNSVLYGHNMRNGSQFHNVRYYVDEAFARAHARIRVTTLYEETEWLVFSAYAVDSSAFEYTQTMFYSDKQYAGFIAAISARSQIDAGVTASETDRVLTLSTCTNTAETMRYAVHAKLVLPEE